MTNLAGIADEDFKDAGLSSAPTEESGEEEELKSLDDEELLDEPSVVDVLNEKTECYHEQGKVTKEILELGEGKRKPMMGWLCKVKYIAYFYDKVIFDTSPQDGHATVDICLGDISWPEGMWRGIQNMRKGEKAKVRIQKKFAYGRPGEVDKLRFPRGYSLEEKDQERRTKLTSKAVIYELTLVDWIERTDMEANGLMYKQWINKQSLKKEHELPNEQYDEVTYSAKIWQYKNTEHLIPENEEAEIANTQILKDIKHFETSMD